MDWSDDPTLKGPFAIVHRGGGIPVVFYFPLAPQFAQVTHPSRGMIHQSLDSNFLDLFPGKRATLSRVQLRGTFGYHRRIGGIGLPLHGSLHLRSIEAIYETFNALDRRLHQRGNIVQEFINLARGYFWQVWIESFSYRIQSTDPLLYYYDLSMARLVDYLSPGGPTLPPSTLPSSTSIAGAF